MQTVEPTFQSRHSHYEAGLKFFSQKKFQAAMTEFRSLIALEPNHAEANFQVGRVFLETFWTKEAVEWFRNAVRLRPDSQKNWQGWAEAVALGGEREDRKVFLSEIKSSKISKKLRKQLEDRFGALRRASRPQLGGVAPVRITQLAASLKSGELSKVEKQAARILATAPRSAAAAFLLGDAQAKQGKNALALGSFKRAIKLDPLYAEAYAAIGQLLYNQNSLNGALEALRPAVILAPDMVPAVVGLAKVLCDLGHYNAAISLFERASKIDNKDARIFVELGDAQSKLGRREDAATSYRSAAALFKNGAPAELRLAAARALEGSARDEELLAVYDSLLEERPDFVDALVAKAEIYLTQGDFDTSRTLFRRALEIDPTNGDAYRQMMASRKSQAGDPVIAEMIGVYEQKDLKDTDRMNLGFAIAKAFEDTREDSRVFEYLNEANQIANKLAGFSTNQRFAEMREFMDLYSDINFENISKFDSNDLAPIFVTGLPRSGTTLVEQIIAAHSEMDSGGELGYASALCRGLLAYRPNIKFGEISEDDVRNVGIRYTEDVKKRFPAAKRITDKSIFTFQHIGPLKCALPNARFIVVRRDPRDNLFSMYKNKFREGTHGYTNNLESLAHFYNEFDQNIAMWRKKVPGWFYEVQYEDLVSNPEEETRKLIAACGLEWEDACLNFHESKNKVRTLSLYQVRQPISKGSVKGWKRFEKDLKPMIDILKKDGHVTD